MSLEDIAQMPTELMLSLFSVSPWETCPLWTDAFVESGEGSVSSWDDVYLPSIAARINSLLSPVELTNDEVKRDLLCLCGYIC